MMSKKDKLQRRDLGLLVYKTQHKVSYKEKAEVLRAFPTFLITGRTFSLISEKFGKEPVLCEQARNCFIWT